MICPKCHQRLVRTKADSGFFFQCKKCGGRAVGISVLRRAIPRRYVKELWLRAKHHGGVRGKPCPVCRRPMVEVPVPVGEQAVPLDVCIGCQFVWFDPHEFTQFPEQPREVSDRLPQKAREAIAVAEMKHEQELARGADFGSDAPEESWKYIPALFGLPVEHEVNPIRSCPWLTWTLTAAMALVFFATWGHLVPIVQEFGLVPAQPLRHGGYTFITSFFLHAGLFHLLGNAYFLMIFGDNVEDYLGPLRYWLLIFAAALFGDLLHTLSDLHDMRPCVGASGGISGVIVFYALQFPQARLGFMIRYWMVFRWFYVPAWFALIGWFLLQFMLASFQLAGIGCVSAMAHLGGAAVGVGAWLMWREGRGVHTNEV